MISRRNRWYDRACSRSFHCRSRRLSLDHDTALVHDHDVFACGVSGDGREGAIFGTEHWRVCGNTLRKFQPISSIKSHWKWCILAWRPLGIAALWVLCHQKWAFTQWLKMLRLVKHCLCDRFHVKIPPKKQLGSPFYATKIHYSEDCS